MIEPRNLAGHLLFLMMAVSFSLFLMPHRTYLLERKSEGAPEQLALGTAATPYQYRVLVPWIVRHFEAPGSISPAHLRRTYAIVEFAALVALGLAFRRYLACFIGEPQLASVLALTIYPILPFHYLRQDYYPYDVPSVLFFIVGPILIYEKRWALFYPFFAMATFNRETTLFLTVLTAFVWVGRQPLRRTAPHLLAQCLVWTAIKAWLFLVFRDNPQAGSGLFQSQLKMNAALVLYLPWYASSALSAWGFLWVPVVLRYRRIESVVLRRTLWLIPVFVGAMMFVGVINETRIYAELLPMVLAAALVIFVDFLRTRFEKSPQLGWSGVERS